MKKNKLGFLAGNFDVIHPGYVQMFKDAKSICDTLVVGLHVDPSEENPDKLKPILSGQERYDLLLSLRYVDEVHLYWTELDLIDLLEKISPDIRILGTDYIGRGFTGDHLNIPIHYHERNHRWSTTRFKKAIAKSLIDKL